jgi:YD repeat-containing protein
MTFWFASLKQFQITGATPTKYKLTYAYNHAGFLTGETYPSGRVLTYAYDDGGRLSGVGDGTTTFASSFAYGPHGGLTSETFGNTAVHTLNYNRRMQASQVKLSLSSTVLQQYDYDYGEFNTSSGAVDTSKNNGQVGKITSTIGTTAQWNQGFSYDELGRTLRVY